MTLPIALMFLGIGIAATLATAGMVAIIYTEVHRNDV